MQPLLQWKCKNVVCMLLMGTCHCQQCNIIECCTKILLWQIHMADYNRMYLGHRVVSDILSDFDQILFVCGKILYNPQYQIPRRSIQ